MAATRVAKHLTWQPSDEQPEEFEIFDSTAALAAHPSRQELLLSAAGWGMIKVWDIDTGLCSTTITGFDHAAHAVLWAGDSKVAAIASIKSHARDIYRWDLGGGGCVPLPTLKEKPYGSGHYVYHGGGLACSSDGNLVAANTLHGASCNVMLWDTRTGNEMTNMFKDEEQGGGVAAIALDGSGRIVLSLQPCTATLRTWDIRTGRLLARVGGMSRGGIASLALNDAGTAALCCIALADTDDPRSHGGVYDLVLGRWANSWRLKDRRTFGVCCTRDFGSVATWHEDGLVKVWRAS